MTSFITPQFVRFLFVGLLNTLVGYSIYLLCLFAGLRVEFALAVATCIGATFNYFTNARLVFAHKGTGRLQRFLGAYAVIYLVNTLAIHLLMFWGLGPALAQAVLLPVMALLAYSSFRLFVFKQLA